MKRATDHLEPSAKRRQERQGRKGDEEDSDEGDVDPGHFAKADDAVLKNRRIFRARREGAGLVSSTATGSATGGQDAGVTARDTSSTEKASAPPATNPFAGITLIAPSSKREDAIQVSPAAASAVAQSDKGELGSTDAMASADYKDDSASSAPPQTSANPEQAVLNAPLQPISQKSEAAAPASAPETDAANADSSDRTRKPDAEECAEEKSDAVDEQKSESGKSQSTTQSKQGSAAPEIAPAKSSDGFTFGSALAAKSSASGFGALAGGKKTAFGVTSLQSPSEGKSAGNGPPSFQGFKSQTDPEKADAPAPKLFGAKTAAISTSPAAKGNDEELMTGEEDEQTVWSADGTLFEFGNEGWKERGKGQARVKSTSKGQGRIIMRQCGNLRLLLNANLWPDMAVNTMDGGIGVTFAVHNAASETLSLEEDKGSEEESAKAKLKMTTYAFRTKAQQALTEFSAAIDAHKGR